MAESFAYISCPKCSHPVVLVEGDSWVEAQYICAGNGIYGYGFCGATFEIKDQGDVDE